MLHHLIVKFWHGCRGCGCLCDGHHDMLNNYCHDCDMGNMVAICTRVLHRPHQCGGMLLIGSAFKNTPGWLAPLCDCDPLYVGNGDLELWASEEVQL